MITHGFLLACAVSLSAHTPGRHRDSTILAALIIALVWLLCAWAYAPYTPSQMILDATGAMVMPRRIWAVQDALAFCAMHWIWWRGRDPVVAIVGVLIFAQIGLHVVATLHGWRWGMVSPYMDRLFEAQLAAVAIQGGWHVGDMVVAGVRNRFVRLARSHGFRSQAVPGDRPSARDRGGGDALPVEQRGRRG